MRSPLTCRVLAFSMGVMIASSALNEAAASDEISLAASLVSDLGQDGASPAPPAGESAEFDLLDDANEWKVVFQPYVWLPAKIDADVTASGITAHLDLSLDEIIDAVDSIFAFSGRLEVWHDDVGVYFDAMYMSMEQSQSARLPGPLQTRVDSKLEWAYAYADLGLGWRVFDGPVDPHGSNDSMMIIDLFAGARYQYLKQELSFNILPTAGTSKDWVEPMIGGRIGYTITEALAVGLRADMSGFGIGSGSDLTWNVITGTDWALAPGWDLKLGYRWLSIDYSNGSGDSAFGFDGTLQGPYLALSIAF